MKTPLIVLNWKMAPERRSDALGLFQEVVRLSRKSRAVKIIVCPPFPFIPLAQKKIGTALLGAQDVSAETAHAHTGEVSALMLRDLGVSHVIIGHSERRAMGENDASVHKKIQLALERMIAPIVCVGERERSHEGDYLAILEQQIRTALAGITEQQLKRISIAYEPVWAIGKSARDAMRPSDIHQSALFIRKVLADRYPRAVAEKIPILYGGAVKEENAKEILSEGRVAGLLVGSASVDTKALRGLITTLITK